MLYTLTACQVIMGLSTIFFIIPVEGVVALTKLVRSWVVRPGAAFVENIHLFEKQKNRRQVDHVIRSLTAPLPTTTTTFY